MIELIKGQTVSVDNHNPIKNDSDSFETIHKDDDMYFLLQDFYGMTIRIGGSKDTVEN